MYVSAESQKTLFEAALKMSDVWYYDYSNEWYRTFVLAIPVEIDKVKNNHDFHIHGYTGKEIMAKNETECISTKAWIYIDFKNDETPTFRVLYNEDDKPQGDEG